MQVSAINAAYSGTQRQMQHDASGHKEAKVLSFEEHLAATRNRGAAMELTDEEIELALQRAMSRMELLLGQEQAEEIVNDDGSINIVRLTQIMNADTSYGNGNRTTLVNAPQVVNLIA